MRIMKNGTYISIAAWLLIFVSMCIREHPSDFISLNPLFIIFWAHYGLQIVTLMAVGYCLPAIFYPKSRYAKWLNWEKWYAENPPSKDNPYVR
jgi:hypothetical protein